VRTIRNNNKPWGKCRAFDTLKSGAYMRIPSLKKEMKTGARAFLGHVGAPDKSIIWRPLKRYIVGYAKTNDSTTNATTNSFYQ
jgi:hypothetical protein